MMADRAMSFYSKDKFRQLLIAEKSDYHLMEASNPQEIQFQFMGPFMGQEVIWHAHLMTLQEYNQHNDLNLNSQQMDIEAIDPENYRIKIVLKLSQLNTASIIMCIKMVRQYKRLNLGRHNWN